MWLIGVVKEKKKEEIRWNDINLKLSGLYSCSWKQGNHAIETDLLHVTN